MSDRYITEKRTRMQYRIDKFKKEHRYIPDLNKDPSGRTGSVVGDDGKRVRFSFNGGTNKKSKIARFSSDSAYYSSEDNSIHMSNADFNSPVRGSENLIFNHEYGHHKDNRYLHKDDRNELDFAVGRPDEKYTRVHDRASSYGLQNYKYKNYHDMDSDEVLADVNSINHTKNGNKVFRKDFENLEKGRHKYGKIKYHDNISEMNKKKNHLLHQKQEIQSRKYSPSFTPKDKEELIEDLNKNIAKVDREYGDFKKSYSRTANTDYYRRKTNIQAAKDPVLRNYMQ